MAKSYLKGITLTIGGNTTGLDKALAGVNKKTYKLQGELKQVDKLLKFDPKNTVLLSQKQKLLSDSVNVTVKKLSSLKEAERQAQKQFAKGKINEEQYRVLQREVAKTESKLKSLERQVKKTNSKFDDIAKSCKKFGTKATATGKSLLPLTTAITGIGTASVIMANKFTDSMAKVSTIADTTKVPLGKLEKQVLQLSDQTGISADLIANDMYNAISAGVDTVDASNAVEHAVKLAKGGFTESGKALDILTTIINAYGKSASETVNISDMLIQTQNKGKTTVAELSESMGKIIPTAKGQNVALEQLTTSYAIMTSKGIATAETTTYLNSMINELGKSGSKTSNLLKEKTGKSFAQLMEDGNSLADVLKIVDDSAKDSGLSMGDMFGRAEAGKAAMTLLSDGVEKFNSGVTEMLNSSGATETAFEKMQTPAEEFKIELNKLKNVSIELGKTMMPLFKELTNKLKGVTTKLKGLSKEQLKSIATTALVVAAVAPLLIIIGKVVSSIGTLITTTKLLWVAMSANPVGAVITAIGLLVLGISAYIGMTNDTAKPQAQAKKRHDEMRQAIDDETQAYNDLKSTQDKQIDNSVTLADRTQRLWEELQSLTDETGKVTEADEKRAKFIMGELNDALGTNLEMTDNQIQGYEDISDSIDNLIAKEKALAIINAEKASFDSAILAVDKEKKTIDELSESINKNKEIVELNEKTLKESKGANLMYSEQARLAQQSIEIERKALEDTVTLYNNHLVDIDNYTKDKENLISGNFDDIKVLHEKSSEDIGIINTDDILEEQRVATEKVRINNQAQLDILGNDSIFYKQRALNDTAQDLEATTRWLNIGTHINSGLKQGLENTKDDPLTEMNNIVESLKTAFTNDETGLGIHSPSTFMSDCGGFMMEGLLCGLKSSWTAVNDWVKEKIQWIKEAFKKAMSRFDKDDDRRSSHSSRHKSRRHTMPMLANGGILTEGQAIVAEAGPEMISVTNGKTYVEPLTNSSQNTPVGKNQGGDIIVNNYSPRALTEAESARQFKKSQRELAFGF